MVFHSHCIISLVNPIRALLEYFDEPHPWHFTPEEIKKMFLEANLKEKFTRIAIFHWKPRNFIKHIMAKAIVRDYYAILEK